jgi:hypothetical protein
MGMFDIFTNNTPAPAPGADPAAPLAPAPVTPPGSTIPAPVDPAAPGQGVVPGSAAVPAAATEPESPLDTFKDLWQPVPVDPNSPAPPTPAAPLTAEQVQTAVSKASFTQAVTPEQMQAIGQGGEAAQQAFSAAMNSVAQQVMVQSTMVNNKLTEKAVATALAAQSAELPQMLREQQSTAHLNDTSKLFSNPAIQPVVQATQSQLLQKFPNATPAEITQMTQDYITAMGEQFAPKPASNPGESTTDWDLFTQGQV